MSPRKSVQQELTREMIMDAANDLFVKKGYQHVSMRQIANELKYSHGAIYYHFKNKAELFYALVEKHFQILDDVLEKIMLKELPPREKLISVLVGFIEFGITHQSHYEIMFLTKDEEVRSFINQGPNKSYEKFAYSVFTLSDKKLTLQEIWLIFLSLHGFITHYSRHVSTYSEVKDLAYSHANFLLR
ncbi:MULTISPECIES: TetR/AcrR family transcriptional regulator [unclassified Bacillus (in: firmicutes)]|uniref:TetR/AcrR family transcriptional regulator n=1 Tax=unclassified Bacillus (in: firmicutes) TaxID=185979 RepID=UPI0008DF239A|nr:MULTISPECIES: TetR/AcrR family transcriptional regulator [unclassified Bacillus (in: firmicutes)]SFB13884.1 regulatory protein, tetR family [Bacillus sp. UNCCL13]SFQ89879.1 regulatory protein, tetR family [Bacillus sp. cl95]